MLPSGNLQRPYKKNTGLLITGGIHDAPSVFLSQLLHENIAFPKSKYSHAATGIGNNASKQAWSTQPLRPRKYLHAALMLAQELRRKAASCILHPHFGL